MILPVLLFLSSIRRTPVSLCFFSRSTPTPMSPHCALPSLSFVILYTLLRIACTVSSSSSPSPSLSCSDIAESSGPFVSGAGVPSAEVPVSPSVVSAFSDADAADEPNTDDEPNTGFEPKENGSDFTGPFVLSGSSDVVLGGLPNPNPTGFPMLPAFGAPKPPLLPAKNDGLPGEAEPKEKGVPDADLSFSGVVAPVLEPVPNGVEEPPEPKSEPAGLSLSVSLSFTLSASFAPNAEPPNDGVDDEPKAEAEEPKMEDAEVELPGLVKSELPEDDDGAPNEKDDVGADVPEADAEAKENADLGASDVVDDSDAAGLEGTKLNGLPSGDTPESSLGTNPPEAGAGALDDEGAEGLNPAKLVGAGGIVNDGGAEGLGASDVVGVDVEAGGALAFDGDLSELTETRSVLYRSSSSATSTKGSDSIAFDTALRKDTFRPRSAL